MVFRFLTLILLMPSLARADHYEVYLLAGQSNAGGHGYVSREFSLFSPNGDDGLQELGRTRYLQPQADAIFIHWRGGSPSAVDPVLWDARSDGWIPMKAGYSLFNYNSASPASSGTEIANHPFGAEVTFTERMREGRMRRTIGHWKLDEPALPWTGESRRALWTQQLHRSHHRLGGLAARERIAPERCSSKESLMNTTLFPALRAPCPLPHACHVRLEPPDLVRNPHRSHSPPKVP